MTKVGLLLSLLYVCPLEKNNDYMEISNGCYIISSDSGLSEYEIYIIEFDECDNY